MWQCGKCREKVEDGFDVCWNCGTSKAGVDDPEFRKADEVPPEQLSESVAAALESAADPRHAKPPVPIKCPSPMRCPYCQSPMQVGKASVQRDAFGAIVDAVGILSGGMGGASHYVYFRRHKGGETVCVDHSRGAFYCPSCQALVLGPANQTQESEAPGKETKKGSQKGEGKSEGGR